VNIQTIDLLPGLITERAGEIFRLSQKFNESGVGIALGGFTIANIVVVF